MMYVRVQNILKTFGSIFFLAKNFHIICFSFGLGQTSPKKNSCVNDSNWTILCAMEIVSISSTHKKLALFNMNLKSLAWDRIMPVPIDQLNWIVYEFV